MRQTTDTPSPGTQPLQALRERIEREASWMQIIRCVAHPYPFIEVQDVSNHGIHVAFSSEVGLSTYISLVGRGRTNA